MKKCNHTAEGPDGLVHTARLPLSSATLNYLADLMRGHLKKIDSRWRALPAGKIATIVLAVPRCDQRPGDLAGGNGVHRTTEITTCRHDKLTAHLRAAGLGAIADRGVVGLDDSGPDTDPAVITGCKAARKRP
ncbi:hypothetical protein [Streptomyces noursei]